VKVFIIAAVTADGFIAKDTHEFPDWTSKEDKQSFVRLTKDAVLIFGGNTFRAIGRPLPNRRNIVYTRQALNVECVETTQDSPQDLIMRLENEGHTEVAICGGSTIYSLFLKAGAVDELYLTIAPLLFGKGVSLLSDPTDTKLELLDQTMLNEDTILLHYTVIR
jgi:dihydrofolate reductase